MVYKEKIEQMDKLEDLLPGIEDFLCNVLANESLSEYAEEQRQYFLERLDIIKLPPSVPPRPQSLGVRLYPVHSTPPSSNRESIRSLEQEDFAAYQRELSRALIGDGDSSPNITEVKVYDDIDATDGSLSEDKSTKVEEEESMYEIPQIQRTLSDSGYEKALELSPMSKSTSSEEQLSGQSGIPMPPPLPPRGERTASDAASRSSVGSILEERISDTLVYRSKLNRESSVPARLEKTADSHSEMTCGGLLDEEYDGASCDSLDEVGTLTCNQDPDLRIKLPRQVKKKHRPHHRKLGKSMSSLWEITQPFSMLEDVIMSGELHYKSKLTWTRKIVALTNGRLVCYKVDKTDSRPAFVILLTGYEATYHKREGRRSFEIHLNHENFESYIFLVDFKEWAEIWCEHINAAAKGERAPGPVVHLARSSMVANPDGTYQMANNNLQLCSSNGSLVSSDGIEAEPGTVKVKKRDQSGTKTARMGSFAFKATQFFESLSKKSSVKKPSSTSSERTPSVERVRQSSGSQSSVGETCEKLSPVTPNSNIAESPLESPLEMKKHIKHQGYLDIYSSFNKRKWGKRWCLVHENNFECYRTQTSEVCELEFLLRNCILRRAIEETKSELGLMLMENNKEKITIEPINWTELGSWLRILMQETSTTATPEGLEGYMDDTNPYHEAVEITRVPDATQRHDRLSDTSKGKSVIKPAELKSEHGICDNRDSGLGLSSADDKFNSTEHNMNTPTVHPCFTDSSLPRVSVSNTGDIYTQVKKSSGSGSSLSPDTGNRRTVNQSTRSSYKMDVDNLCDIHKVKSVRKSDNDDDKLFFDFDISSFGNPAFKRGSSLVDEIMSELKSQQNNNVQTADDTEDNTNDLDNSKSNLNERTKRKSAEFIPAENELSPIKSTDVTLTENEKSFLCSSFDENAEIHSRNGISSLDSCDKEIHDRKSISSLGDKANTGRHVIEAKGVLNEKKQAVVLRRHPSNASTAGVKDETLPELRTRLVQLKKDRISIRDRKQMISSETDREFLEAEYERLDRECKKVENEIKTIEDSTVVMADTDKNSDSKDQLEVDEVKRQGSNEQNTNNSENDCFCGNIVEEETARYSKQEEMIQAGNEEEDSGDDNEVHLGEKGSNIDQVNGVFSVESKLLQADSKTKIDDTNTGRDVIKDLQCTSHLPASNSHVYTSDGVSASDNQYNTESNIVCDTETVPNTRNSPEDTQGQNTEMTVSKGDNQESESQVAGSTSSDYVIDKLSKEFENKLFLKEK